VRLAGRVRINPDPLGRLTASGILTVRGAMSSPDRAAYPDSLLGWRELEQRTLAAMAAVSEDWRRRHVVASSADVKVRATKSLHEKPARRRPGQAQQAEQAP